MSQPPLLLVSIAAAVVVSATALPSRDQTPQAPVFRSAIALVPVDVRVVDDRTGQPVTDLKRGDFRVLEDGVVQEIRHFEVQETDERGLAMAGEDWAPGVSTRARKQTTNLAAATNRVFLCVLGTGRLQLPSKGLDAMVHFVRHRTLPRDLVAVLAYDRATDFTTDHERVARVIERFRDENAAIDSALVQATTSLAAVYGRRVLPKEVQARIDRVFDADAGPRSLVVSSALDERLGGEFDDAVRHLDAGAIAGGGFESFVSALWLTARDIGNIQAGLAYLRELDGEKHLLFVTERGFLLPRVEDDTDLARSASDARVTINIIQTGGVIGDVLYAAAMRAIATDTGGMAAISQYSQPALDRLDAATRYSYLLGYYPTNPTLDLRFRRIQVRVNRPHATVLYRRGYFARASDPAFSRENFITHQRLLSAATYRKPITDIDIALRAGFVATKGGRQIRIEATIDPRALHFSEENGLHVGRIDIAQFAMNATGRIAAEGWQTVDLQFTEDTFLRVSKERIPYKVRLPVKSDVAEVVLAVYDAKADKVGTARQALR